MQSGLLLIDRREIDDCWGTLSSYIYAYNKGIPAIYTPDELYDEIKNNPDFFVWVFLENSNLQGVFITIFTRLTQRTTLWIVAVNSHNLKEYLQYFPQLEKWAMTYGAQDIAFEGSPGWERILKRNSYYAKTKVYRKDVMKAWSN